MEYFSAIALEDIENLSVAIKTDDGIRKVKNFQDMRENLSVLIISVKPIKDASYELTENDRFEIPKGTAVRYVKVSVVG